MSFFTSVEVAPRGHDEFIGTMKLGAVRPLGQLDCDCCSFAAADADCCNAAFEATFFQRVQQGYHNPCTRCTDGMAKGAGASVDVHNVSCVNISRKLWFLIKFDFLEFHDFSSGDQ